jgi:desulfoferrodoxin (superoxide reductase-like protein)
VNIPVGVERIDCNEDGTLDDVAISIGDGMFRIEQNSKHSWWVALYLADGRVFTVTLSSKARVHANHQMLDRPAAHPPDR